MRKIQGEFMSRSRELAALLVAVTSAMPVTGWSQIEEIVVTTRKKEETLQDVPIAVTAITEEQIQRQGVADLEDIVQNNPSVQFDRSFGPSDTRVTIRGLSNTRGRSNVAFLVDGIDVTTENLIVSGSGLLANRRLLTDVQRVEIVKGPQSALYGRAAFAGAINYITKEPGDIVEGTARMDFADDGFQQIDGAVGGPISDTLGMRVTGFWYNQDGHYINTISGDDVGGSGGSGAALTAVWKPGDITKIKMRGEFSREDFDPLANFRIGGTWQNAPGVKLFEYPDAVYQNALNRLANPTLPNGLGATTSTDSTSLLDFNQYCPQALRDPSKGPGLCLPTTYGSAAGRVIKHSEKPLTGQDFDGTDLQTFRFSTIAEFDTDIGLISSYTAWTNFDGSDNYDQDWQAEGTDYRYAAFDNVDSPHPIVTGPAFYNGRIPDQLTAGQIANTESEVNQFSQEFRFSSKLDGPFNYTLGALFWDEVRQLEDSNSITACMPFDKVGSLTVDGDGNPVFPTFNYQPGVCDGTNGTVVGWQNYYRQLQNDPNPQRASHWEADTRHWSFYFNLSFELAENWTLDLEDRFVSESFTLRKPNSSTCTSLGYLGVIGQTFRAETPTFDAVCAYNEITAEVGELPPGATLGSTDNIRLLEGTADSHFSTPKVTLRWQVTPDNQLYFYWARAQKPGGINQLAPGGSPVTKQFEAFDPEKLEAWEFGSKNLFDVRGPLIANMAFFFQDYSEKQVNTQIVTESGVAQPKVLNASGAEIWGAEFEFTWQPDMIEGLALTAAYTYLDAKYTKFFDEVTSLQRLAYAGQGCELVYRNFNNEIVGPSAPGIRQIACRVDYSGKQLERTPENALALSASYTRPLSDTGLDLLAELNGSWQDERYLDQENGVKFDAFWLVDARLGLTTPKYEIVAYVDNLLDDDTIRSGGSGPDFGRQVAELGFTAGLGLSHFFGTMPDPRIFGIRATYRFGEK